jgi:DNA primase
VRLFIKTFDNSDARGEKIRQYWMDDRTFSLDAAKKKGIDLAGNNDRARVKIIFNTGYSLDALKAGGLFYYKKHETDLNRFTIMRFHSRLTIPIRDIQGKIVGLSARLVDRMRQPNNLVDAKYRKSPATALFEKGTISFDLDRAWQYLEPNDAFSIVERQLDMMRCRDNGIPLASRPRERQ